MQRAETLGCAAAEPDVTSHVVSDIIGAARVYDDSVSGLPPASDSSSTAAALDDSSDADVGMPLSRPKGDNSIVNPMGSVVVDIHARTGFDAKEDAGAGVGASVGAGAGARGGSERARADRNSSRPRSPRPNKRARCSPDEGHRGRRTGTPSESLGRRGQRSSPLEEPLMTASCDC